MKFKIITISYYTDITTDKSYKNCKFYYKNQGFWVSEQAFINFPNFVKVKYNRVILNEPLNMYYDIAKLSNRNGVFYALIPKNANIDKLHVSKIGRNVYKDAQIQSFDQFFTKEGVDFALDSDGSERPWFPQVVMPSPTKQHFLSALIPFMKYADHKSRVKYLELVTREMDRLPDIEKRLMREINKLKHGVMVQRDEKTSVETKNIIDLSKHKPSDVLRFLDLFRESNGIKYLTHDFDKPNQNFSHEKILNIARKEFYQYTKNKFLPIALYNRFRMFAFGDGGSKKWFFNKEAYELNWYAPYVLKWCKENPDMHPINNPEISRKMIIPFQQSYKIVAPELVTLLNNKLTESLGELYTAFDIRFIDCEHANLVTDVDSFLSGIGYIFKSIKQRHAQSNRIIVRYTRRLRNSYITIIHVGSKSKKRLDKTELFGSGTGGDLTEAEKRFYRVCDWSIVAQNPDKRINQLNVLFDATKNTQVKTYTEAPIEGFTHILKFYR